MKRAESGDIELSRFYDVAENLVVDNGVQNKITELYKNFTFTFLLISDVKFLIFVLIFEASEAFLKGDFKYIK